MREIEEIIVHCTATPEGRNVTVEEIDRWHKEKGYKGIGYHYVVYIDGTIHKGREESKFGAHCIGHNTNSIGVCYVGGMDKDNKYAKDTRTPSQKDALIAILCMLKKSYPKAGIFGHRDFSNKECPSFDAKEEYKYISEYKEIPKCKIV